MLSILLSVVVDDLDVFWSCRRPAEADPPLLVDPDAVPPRPIAAQLLQLFPGGGTLASSSVSAASRISSFRSAAR
jgi:hypothetical protein